MTTKSKLIIGSIVFAVLVVLTIIILYATGYINSPASAPTYISKNEIVLDGENAIKEMYTATTDLVNMLNQYANERLSNETTSQTFLTQANTNMTIVQNAYNASQTNYNNYMANQTQVAAAITTIQTNVTTLSGILTNIQNIIAGTATTPASGTSYGTQFGTGLTQIETLKNSAFDIFNTNQNRIGVVRNQMRFASSTHFTLANQLSGAINALNQLTTLFNTIFADYTNTTQYKNLQNSIANSQYMLSTINDILTSQGGANYSYTQSLNALKTNLQNSIAVANNYLNNVISLITLIGTTNSNSPISTNVTTITNIFNQTLNLIGSYNIGGTGATIINLPTPTPWTTPVNIQTNPNSILSYYNSMVNTNATLVSQYNSLLEVYNQGIGYINQIQTLTNTVITNNINNSNNMNAALLVAQESLRLFFPGSTTPGVSTYNVQTTPIVPIPTLPTVTPGPFMATTMTPKTI